MDNRRLWCLWTAYGDFAEEQFVWVSVVTPTAGDLRAKYSTINGGTYVVIKPKGYKREKGQHV
jgi:hypothetical protein